MLYRRRSRRPLAEKRILNVRLMRTWLTQLRGGLAPVGILDGIEGCGDALSTTCRELTFSVLEQVTTHLTTTKSQKNMFFLLNALRWKYSAHDQPFLHRIRVFRALEGAPGSAVYQAWRESNFYFTKTSTDAPTVAREVLNTFEFVFFGLVSRTLSLFEKTSVSVS